jgi:hypothetical protein
MIWSRVTLSPSFPGLTVCILRPRFRAFLLARMRRARLALARRHVSQERNFGLRVAKCLSHTHHLRCRVDEVP